MASVDSDRLQTVESSVSVYAYRNGMLCDSWQIHSACKAQILGLVLLAGYFLLGRQLGEELALARILTGCGKNIAMADKTPSRMSYAEPWSLRSWLLSV